MLRRKLDKVEERRRAVAPLSEHGGRVSFAHQPAARRRLLTHQGPLRAGDQVIVDDASVVVERTTASGCRGETERASRPCCGPWSKRLTWPERLLFLPQELDESGRAGGAPCWRLEPRGAG